MSKYKVIANPAAGGGAGRKALTGVEKWLSRYGVDYESVLTSYPGHAVEIAREAVLNERVDVVAAVGGDGTCNEVINGVMQAKAGGDHHAAVGVIGAGRGNDFGDALGLPREMDAACRVLAQNRRRRIDLGRVVVDDQQPGRYFGNCVGIGFDAIGTIEAAKLPRLGGFMSYLVAVLKTITLYYRAPLTTVRYGEHELTQPSLLVSIMNGRRIGGGFLMAPGAVVDDGLLDLCIAGQMSRRRMFAMIRHFLKGTQASQREIKTGRGAVISVAAVEGTLPAQTDGEILCVDGKKIEVELMPGHLEVVC